MLEFVTTLNEIENNVSYLENALKTKDKAVSDYAKDIIKRGRCFYVKRIGKGYQFYPSKFIGYPRMTIEKYEKLKLEAHNAPDFDGRLTNQAIVKVLGTQVQIGNDPSLQKQLDEEYIAFCNRLNVTPHNIKNRRYWLKEVYERHFEKSIDEAEEFLEGSIKEKNHRYKERNSKVVKLAKRLFYEKHGRLFCEACDFDFIKVYGELGEHFIEAHHNIPVSTMKENHKTKVEDFDMLCANCHRMIHKNKEELTLTELKRILKVNNRKNH
jgi:hypothetical protein